MSKLKQKPPRRPRGAQSQSLAPEPGAEEEVVVEEAVPSISEEDDSIMDGLSVSLKDKIATVLESEVDKPPLEVEDSDLTTGPLGNHDFIEPGSIKHLFLLGFDEFGNYLSDLAHLTDEQSEMFVATRLRWWYKARAETKSGKIDFPAGCPPAHSFDEYDLAAEESSITA